MADVTWSYKSIIKSTKRAAQMISAVLYTQRGDRAASKIKPVLVCLSVAELKPQFVTDHLPPVNHLETAEFAGRAASGSFPGRPQSALKRTDSSAQRSPADCCVQRRETKEPQ